MFVLASPIVDWSAMWKICLVAFAAGAGVVIVFGFLLLGLKIANRPRTGGTQGAGSRFTGYALSAVCGVIVIGVIVVGIYAMTQKPSSAKPKPKTKSAAVITTPVRQHQLVA
jgi:hypothetical protein